MERWRLYTSGLCWGEFEVERGEIQYMPFDFSKGALTAAHPLTEEENAEIRAFTHLDPAALLCSLAQYDQALAMGPAEVCISGAAYQRAQKGRYIQRKVKFPANITWVEGHVCAFTSPSRERVHLLVRAGTETHTILAQWRRAYPLEKPYPVKDLGEQFVFMRDGVRLAARLLLPGGAGDALPAVLVRTPYGKEGDLPSYYRYVQRGYAVVIQDVRGRNHSEGEWIPNFHEVEDGSDTLDWIAAQSWSNGRVGMIGGSYLGYVQWAAAASGNPHLKAMVSVMCAGSGFQDLPRKGGGFMSGLLAWVFAVSQRTFRPDLMARDDWEELLRIRPLEEIPQRALGYDIPFFQEWLRHPDYDDFWKQGDWAARMNHTDVPALIMSGWFDDDGMGTTEALDVTRGCSAKNRKVLLGPWPHGGNAVYDLPDLPLEADALREDVDLLFFQWFDRHLKGVHNGVESGPAVEYYTLGSECWQTAEDWPPPSGAPFSLYLAGEGSANTSGGDGTLLPSPPAEACYDEYLFDPSDPASCIIDLSENEVAMPADYRREDARADVLCYTTPPLAQDITFTGDFTVELFISSDAVDTDFVVRICQVDPDGRSLKLADGLLSARYRRGFDAPAPMKPGKVYPLSIRTSKVSNTFKKGSRIRLTVTSGAKNWIFPNSNTEKGFNSGSFVTAHNRIFHGGDFSSRLIAWKEPSEKEGPLFDLPSPCTEEGRPAK